MTPNTYGNVVASFFPGKAPADALEDATMGPDVSAVDNAGYPEYAVECEADGHCVNGTGTPIGSTQEVAKTLWPVNPKDIGLYGIQCSQYLCKDGDGNVIGRNPNLK